MSETQVTALRMAPSCPSVFQPCQRCLGSARSERSNGFKRPSFPPWALMAVFRQYSSSTRQGNTETPAARAGRLVNWYAAFNSEQRSCSRLLRKYLSATRKEDSVALHLKAQLEVSRCVDTKVCASAVSQQWCRHSKACAGRGCKSSHIISSNTSIQVSVYGLASGTAPCFACTLPDHPVACRRVMLKISGEALQGGMGFGVDPQVIWAKFHKSPVMLITS